MKRFRVIEGGKGSDDFDNAVAVCRKKLDEIDISRRVAYASAIGPAGGRGMIAFAATALFLDLLVTATLEHVALPNWPWGWLSVGVGFVVGVVVFRGHPDKSWSARIYRLLAEYTPIDGKAYRRLQDQVRADGLTHDALIDWIAQERQALSADFDQSKKSFRDRFLSK
jgi:hypothetical protein